MFVPLILSTWISASPAKAAGCKDTTHLWSAKSDSLPLWRNPDSTDGKGPSYFALRHEVLLAKECRKGWVRVVTKIGTMHWVPLASLARFEPAVMASADLGCGKIDGYLDNPSAVYILSEAASPPPSSLAFREDERFGTTRSGGGSEASGLRAGVADDNQQFGAFLGFLSGIGAETPHVRSQVGERIKVAAVDSKGRSLPDLPVRVTSKNVVLETGRTLADGSYKLYPRLWTDSVAAFDLAIGTGNNPIRVDRNGPREIEVRLPDSLRSSKDIPVDLVFVMDATSSMSQEIDRLKKAVSILEMNLSSMPIKAKLRMGLVEYRDSGDDYRVRRILLTSDLERFAADLEKVTAGGGGDSPEDLQSALDTTVRAMNWTENGIRLAYVVTDAPPHLDYGQTFTYMDAAHLARRKGIKIHTVGAGGLPLGGEVAMRQIAQATSGKYVFLTYGERGESDGGHKASVSHHTGDNWSSERLETVLLRLAREEIARIADVPPVDSSGWFDATKSGSESRDSILANLFRQAQRELVDYSSMSIQDSSAIAILPMVAEADSAKPAARALEQNLTIAFSRSNKFRLVDRGNLGTILRELALQHSGAVDGAKVSETGKLLGAKYLLSSGLVVRGARYELLVKLLRVETGEVLSATRARVDRSLVD